MTKQLISSKKAKPRKVQHTKPCSDCPWARTALVNWLGPLDVDEWIEVAHGDGEPGCHTTTNQSCAGLAIFRANVCKQPRDPKALRLPRDAVKVFVSDVEFKAHHTKHDITIVLCRECDAPRRIGHFRRCSQWRSSF